MPALLTMAILSACDPFPIPGLEYSIYAWNQMLEWGERCNAPPFTCKHPISVTQNAFKSDVFVEMAARRSSVASLLLLLEVFAQGRESSENWNFFYGVIYILCKLKLVVAKHTIEIASLHADIVQHSPTEDCGWHSKIMHRKLTEWPGSEDMIQ